MVVNQTSEAFEFFGCDRGNSNKTVSVSKDMRRNYVSK